MWQISQSVVCCVLVVVCACAQAQPEGASRAVRISQGPLRGFKAPGEDYFVFYNIPYATAPTGTDRFKAPLPGPVWLTERLAVEQNVTCPQNNYKGLLPYARMQENCLIANVFMPDTDQTNLPVVVYVHGGAYFGGFGNMGIPKLLMNTKKFVAVTFNYRLGIHGFLCLGTHDVPGNAGMKDQVALLRWVKQNIAQFGGNPNDVTIDGYSAGSSAVDLLILSDAAKGLFHKAIPESGANLSPWSIQQDPIENARSYAEEFFNFKGGDDILALEKLYKTLTYDVFTERVILDRQHFNFAPCVERDIGVERFLKKSPYEILKEGKYNKVPMLYGFANMEGLFRLDLFQNWKDGLNSNFADFLPADLKFKDEQERQNVAAIVKEFYFGKEPVSDDTIVSYVDYFTDVMFGISTVWSAKLQVEAGNNNVYLYLFSYAEESLAKLAGITDARLVGANHVAQTFMLLDLAPYSLFQDSNTIPADYKNVQSLMLELWTNFISTGKPVPEGSSLLAWPAAGASGAPHMVIDRQLALGGPLLGERAQFWLRLYEDYYSVPSPPAHSPTKQHAEL